MTSDELRRLVVTACIDHVENGTEWSPARLADEAGEGVEVYHVKNTVQWMASERWVAGAAAGGELTVNESYLDQMKVFANPLPKASNVAPVALVEGQVDSSQVYGDWKVLESLGGGGQADVHLVRRELRGDLGALKVPRPRKAGDEREMKRFHREIEALNRLRGHPGVVELLDHQKGDNPWLVTRFAPMGSLQGNLRYFEGDALRVLRVARDIASALASAHAMGTVHRDLKPANLLLFSMDRVTLSDFGIAFAKDDARVTTARAAATVWYSPSWAREGAEVEPDATLDVHALGKVIYVMIRGGGRFGKAGFESGDDEVSEALSRPDLAPITRLLSRLIRDDRESTVQTMAEVVGLIDATVRAVLSGGEDVSPWQVAAPPSAPDEAVPKQGELLKHLIQEDALPMLELAITRQVMVGQQLTMGLKIRNMTAVPAVNAVVLVEGARIGDPRTIPGNEEVASNVKVQGKVPPASLQIEYSIPRGKRIRDTYQHSSAHSYALIERAVVGEAFGLP